MRRVIGSQVSTVRDQLAFALALALKEKGSNLEKVTGEVTLGQIIRLACS